MELALSRSPQEDTGLVVLGDLAGLQLCCVTLGKLLVLSEPMQNEEACPRRLKL